MEVTLYILEKNRETLLLVSCFDTSGSITTRMQSNNQSLRMQIRETNLIRVWFSIKCLPKFIRITEKYHDQKHKHV